MGPNLLPRDGEAFLEESWLGREQADDLMRQLVDGLDWQQEHARFGAKVVPLPRLTAWSGDVGYRYSGVVHPARPWPPVLADLRDRVARVAPPEPPHGPATGQPAGAAARAGPNSVLVNFYRDGNDSMGWHSDDEPVLGDQPTIWSLSLGASRRFAFRHRTFREHVDVELTHGSLLVMSGACQRCWQHALPKTSRPAGPRVNLTFRLTAEG